MVSKKLHQYTIYRPIICSLRIINKYDTCSISRYPCIVGSVFTRSYSICLLSQLYKTEWTNMMEHTLHTTMAFVVSSGLLSQTILDSNIQFTANNPTISDILKKTFRNKEIHLMTSTKAKQFYSTLKGVNFQNRIFYVFTLRFL